MSRIEKPQSFPPKYEELEARLYEAEETLRAIRSGEIDALVVSGPAGEQVYTLKTSEHLYRVLVEAMNEGALTLSQDGTILYCNQSFAALLKTPSECVLGCALNRFVIPADLPRLDALLRQSQTGGAKGAKGEMTLLSGEGSEIPTQLSLSPLPSEDTHSVSVVVTDLTEQKRQQELVASEKLLRSILEQAAAATVVCDEHGTIIHASRRTYELCAFNPVLHSFDEVLPLRFSPTDKLRPQPDEERLESVPERLTFPAIVRHKKLHGLEVIFHRPDGQAVELLLSAGLIQDFQGKMLGCVVTMMDITERKEAEAERERLLAREQKLRLKAEEASRLKDEFLAVVSHELKTPLNAINGWAELLRGGSLSGEQVQQAIETVARNAKAQRQIIDDLLDMSRIITGKMHLDIKSLSLTQVIQAAIETVRHAAEIKKIQLEVVPDPTLEMVLGDFDRLQQVVWNLLSNAIKFTPKGGLVLIKTFRSDSQVELSVSDSGQGIKPGFLPYVFDRFRQEDGTTRRQHGGLGLGLAIVRQLVELHGGSVQVESPGEGQGATFRVLLPVRGKNSGTLTQKGPNRDRNAQQLLANGLAGSISGIRILLVDDELDTLVLTKLILEKGGAEVQTADSASEGFRLFTECRPDVIVSDIGMAREDGYDFLRHVRELDKIVPAVALTAYARTEDRIQAFSAGFQMHVSKPVEPEELLAVVASLAKSNRK